MTDSGTRESAQPIQRICIANEGVGSAHARIMQYSEAVMYLAIELIIICVTGEYTR